MSKEDIYPSLRSKVGSLRSGEATVRQARKLWKVPPLSEVKKDNVYDVSVVMTPDTLLTPDKSLPAAGASHSTL